MIASSNRRTTRRVPARTRQDVFHLGRVWVGAVMTLLAVVSGQAHTPAVVISGSGTATIDGVANAGEWASAGCVPIAVNVPGGTTGGNACAMNDDDNLYLMVAFARPAGDLANSVVFEFDNDHGGNPRVSGDDVLVVNPSIGFSDVVRTTIGCPHPGALCGFRDVDVGGTNEGSGAFVNDGTFTTYEFSHPLDTADDANDFSLRRGDTVGFTLILVIQAPDSSFHLTGFPTLCEVCADQFGDIILSSPSIPIDIKPGSFPNSVNPRSQGTVPVAILSTPTFDAPASVEPISPTFGRTGDEQSLAFCGPSPEDANGDAIPDLICHFATPDTGLLPGDTVGTLKARLFDGRVVSGADFVRIVP